LPFRRAFSIGAFTVFPSACSLPEPCLVKTGLEPEEECRALLRILQSGCHEAVQPKLVRVLLLQHGATHNLLRDHGLSETMFRFIDDTKKDRGQAFLEKVYAESGTPAVVIADEITCLEVAGANNRQPNPWPVKLLNHGLGDEPTQLEGASAGSYFSVGVRSSATDWLRFFDNAIPLTLELYRERIAEAHSDLFRTLKRWTREQRPDMDMERIHNWCRSVLLLDRPNSLGPEWKPVLERAQELIPKEAGAIVGEA
jgi:hypothetical protein